MYLPDINFWLALTFDRHKHHIPARAWFDGSPAERQYYFCRLTQIGFLRLATNPAANPLQTQTMSQAWLVYDGLLAGPRIGYATEPNGMEGPWRNRSQLGTFSPNVWSDAYLAAFAQAGGFEIVTFDQGFTQYQDVPRTILP